MRKIVLIFLILCGGIDSAFGFVFAGEKTFVVDGIYYIVDDADSENSVGVFNGDWNNLNEYIPDPDSPETNPIICNGRYSGDIVIPSAVQYEGISYKVKRIANAAFANCSELKSVTLPETVGYIANYAFYDCPNLEKVYIPGRVRGVLSDTFTYCSALKTLDLANAYGYVKLNLGSCGIERIVLPRDAIIYDIDAGGRDVTLYMGGLRIPYTFTVNFANFGAESVCYIPSPFFTNFWPGTIKYIVGAEEAGADTVDFEKAVAWSLKDAMIEAASRPVEIYTIEGRLVSVVAPYSQQQLRQGIYVVRCGDSSEKVMIR